MKERSEKEYIEKSWLCHWVRFTFRVVVTPLANLSFNVSNLSFDVSNLSFDVSTLSFDVSNLSFDVSSLSFDV